MKKIYLILSLLLITGIANAQTPQFGVRARYSSAKMSTNQGNITSTTDAIQNIDAGLFAEIVYGDVSFQPGLAFIVKGGAQSSSVFTSTNNYSATATLKFNYLELPLNVVYNIKLNSGKIFFGGGPFIGYALSGKAKLETTSYNAGGSVIARESDSQKISFTSDTNDFKRFEVGINALAGFRFKDGLEINLGLGEGLTNITNDNNNKITHHTISGGLAYWFQ